MIESMLSRTHAFWLGPVIGFLVGGIACGMITSAHAQSRDMPTGFVGVDYGRYQWLPGDWYECTAKKCDMANETFSMTPMYVLCQRSWGGPGFTPWETEFRAFRDERACHDAEGVMNVGFNGLNGVEEQMYCVYDPHWRRR